MDLARRDDVRGDRCFYTLAEGQSEIATQLGVIVGVANSNQSIGIDETNTFQLKFFI